MSALGEFANRAIPQVLVTGLAFSGFLGGCSPSRSFAERPFSFVVDDACVLARVQTTAVPSLPPEAKELELTWLKLVRDGRGRTLLTVTDLLASPGASSRPTAKQSLLLRPYDPGLVGREGSCQYSGQGLLFQGTIDANKHEFDRTTAISYVCTLMSAPPWWARGEDRRRSEWIEVEVRWSDEVGSRRQESKGYLVFRWGPDGKPIVHCPAQGIVFAEATPPTSTQSDGMLETPP